MNIPNVLWVTCMGPLPALNMESLEMGYIFVICTVLVAWDHWLFHRIFCINILKYGSISLNTIIRNIISNKVTRLCAFVDFEKAFYWVNSDLPYTDSNNIMLMEKSLKQYVNYTVTHGHV